MSFSDSCDILAAALKGSVRSEILAAISAKPLDKLRTAMRRHEFPMASGSLELKRIVDSLDARSRQEGFHLIQAWDYAAHRFSDDSIPVLLLDYCVRLTARKSDDRAAAAALLDQYFLAVLSLLAVRAWDEGDANENLDRVNALITTVQGPNGSGHRFIEDAESLLFLAVSYFHPDEACYGRLLGKVEALDDAHQLRVAHACAAMLGAHLRWGLRFMYQRDAGTMRNDNVVDYPWLLHAVATLAREFARGGEQRERVVESLLAGLSADPWAFTGSMPGLLAAQTPRYDELRGVLDAHRATLLDELEKLRPAKGAYAPLGFTCNFPTNAAVALVAVALEDGRKYQPLNALFRRESSGAQELALRLMDYSVSDPGRLGAGGAPLIAYDPYDGMTAFNAVVKAVR